MLDSLNGVNDLSLCFFVIEMPRQMTATRRRRRCQRSSFDLKMNMYLLESRSLCADCGTIVASTRIPQFKIQVSSMRFALATTGI